MSREDKTVYSVVGLIVLAYLLTFGWFWCGMLKGQSTNQPPPAAPCTQPATTQPVYLLSPPTGTVIQNVDVKCVPPGSQMVGIGANNSSDLIVQFSRVDGFNFGLSFTGANPNLHLRYDVVVNSTPNPADNTPTSSDDSSGVYAEGCDQLDMQYVIVLDCGWWPGADFTNANTRAVLSRHHGDYNNESHGTTDAKRIHDCIFLNNAGSQIGNRLGGEIYNNVFESGFDWDVVIGGLGSFTPAQTPYGKWARVYGNVTFGPRLNVNPYYGGGFTLDPAGMGRPGCDGVISGNSGMSAATISPHAIAVDASGNVIQQLGWWGTGGAVVPGAGQHVWTLVDYYQTLTSAQVTPSNFYALMKCDDAPKIRAWLATKVSASPPVIGSGTTATGQGFNVVAK